MAIVVVIEFAALLVLAHSLAHVLAMAVAGRRILLEIGLRRYDPARHRLYYQREGRGPAVVFLHALGGSWRYWRRGLNGF